MNHLLDLIVRVLSLLAPALPGVRLAAAYDPEKRGAGIPRPAIVLALESAETVERGDDYLGSLNAQEEMLLRGRLMDITLCMTLLGGEKGAKGCYELLDAVLQQLLFSAPELYLRSVAAQQPQYSERERSVSLCCRLTLRCLITRQEESEGYQNIVIRRKED